MEESIADINTSRQHVSNKTRFRTGMFAVAVVTIMVAALIVKGAATPGDWPMFGQNASNTANNSSERDLTASLVGKMKV